MNAFLIVRTFLLIAACLCLLPAASAAEEEAVQTETEKTVESPAEEEIAPAQEETSAEEAPVQTDFTKIEGTGLYRKESEGGLGRDLWLNSKRSEIIDLIENMPVSSSSPVVHKLVLQALLTEVDMGSMQNDIAPEAGRDFLTVRLEKLLQAGAYKHAFELYSQIKTGPYHERIAKAGILAMFYNGEKSLACLETNATQESFPESEFLKDVSAYCDAALSEQPDEEKLAALQSSQHKLLAPLATQKTYRFQYSPESYAALSQLEQAVLIAESKLDLSGIDVQAVPVEHIQALLKDQNIDEKQRFFLTAQTVYWGLGPMEDLKKLYKAAIAPAAGESPDAAATETLPQEDWQKLPFLYHRVENAAKGEERWKIISEALPLHHTMETPVFLPFAEFIRQDAPQDANFAEIIAAYKIMAASGASIPRSWSDLASQKDLQDTDKTQYLLLLTAAHSAQPESEKSPEKREKFLSILAESDGFAQEFVNNIIENVDKGYATHDNALNAYEKEYRLTFEVDYVMPSVFVWDRMKETSQTKAVGETILLNSVLLSDQALHKTYPGLLRDVLQGFESVGLTNISRDLVISASLGSIK